MDFTTETMDEELKNCLIKAGVREDVLDSLEEDELYTVGQLEATSDNLLKQCGIKVGQIVRLRDGIKRFKDQQKECELSGVYPMKASSPLTIHSTPKPQRMSSTPTSSPLTSSLCSQPTSSLNDVENEEPDCKISCAKVSCFADTKCVLKNDGKWLQKFELPAQFSPRVSQALEAKKMSSSERNDFTRDITTSMMAYTLYPTKSEREHVAFMIIKKYPFLADKLGTGIGSWEQAIKNRLKNRRKNKPAAVKRPSEKPLESVKPKKVQKMLDLSRIPAKPEGETIETCREHAGAMRKEMMKTSNRKASMIRDLMDLTFPFRRERILMEPTAVEDIVKEYPALKLVSEFKAEFGRVMGDKTLLKTMTDTFTSVLKPKVLKLAKEKQLDKSLMEEAISNDIGKKSDTEDTAAILMLPQLMSSKGTADLLTICSDDESIDDVIKQSVVPQLIGGGEMADVTPLYLVVERNAVLKFNSGISTAQTLAMLMACYYIFNIEYPSNLRNVFVMLEATIMGRSHEAKRRVVVNKFLQEINYEV